MESATSLVNGLTTFNYIYWAFAFVASVLLGWKAIEILTDVCVKGRRRSNRPPLGGGNNAGSIFSVLWLDGSRGGFLCADTWLAFMEPSSRRSLVTS
jgi:hypothetical protein